LKVEFGGSEYRFRPAPDESLADLGSSVFLGFRPESIVPDVSPKDDSPEGGWLEGCAGISSVEAMGSETLVYMEDGDFRPVARLAADAATGRAFTDGGGIEPGSELRFRVPREALHFFHAVSGQRIRMEWD
jgi:ABC-type sugar transport system ATPase subunit